MHRFMPTKETKKCVRCGNEKSVKEFHKNKSIKSGLASYCKECTRKYAKEYFQRPEVKKRLKEYRAENYPEYYQKIKEEKKEYNRNRYRERRIEMGKKVRQWGHIDCRPKAFRDIFKTRMRHSPVLIKKSEFKRNAIVCNKNCIYWKECNKELKR